MPSHASWSFRRCVNAEKRRRRRRAAAAEEMTAVMGNKNEMTRSVYSFSIFPYHNYHHTHNLLTHHLTNTTFYSSAKHFVAVATPVPPCTVFLPPIHAGPSPNSLLTTVVVVSAQPLQSINSVFVRGGTVISQPKGSVEVTTWVQVGEAEQAVTVVVVFERVVGRTQRTWLGC